MISVIIPSYNRSASLRRTLRSMEAVEAPSQLQWELIIADNNSTDDTRACVKEFEDAGSLPIRYVFEKNQGANFARNAGVKAARGETLLFTDDDVTFDPYWLAGIADAVN